MYPPGATYTTSRRRQLLPTGQTSTLLYFRGEMKPLVVLAQRQLRLPLASKRAKGAHGHGSRIAPKPAASPKTHSGQCISPPPPNPTGMAPLAKEPSSPGDGSGMPPPKTSTPFPGILHPHVWGHGDPHLNPRGGGSPAAPPGAGSPTQPYQPHPLPQQHPLYLSRKIGEVKRRRREAPGGQGGFCLSPFPADSAH